MTAANGDIIGCDNKTLLVESIERCIKFVLQNIQISKAELEKQFLDDIRQIQKDQKPADIEALKNEVENLKQKKKNAIDLMLEGLISRDDLAEQNEFYTQRIEELNKQIGDSTDMAGTFEKQIKQIKSYIKTINNTDKLDIEDTKVYADIVDRIVVQNNRLIDIYLTFLPFGYRVAYTLQKTNRHQKFDVIIDSCEIIS